MSRDIIFRVWDSGTKAMHQPALKLLNGKQTPLPKVEHRRVSEPKNWTWLQYTGLKDHNGTEIYEGDIIRCFPDDSDDEAREVVYCGDRDYPAFDLKPDIGADSNGLSNAIAEGQIEVIGNIYENPGLVK